MLLETDPLTVRSRVVMVLRMRLHRGPTALLGRAALVRKRSRGRPLRVSTVKRVGWVESVG